MKGSLRAYFAMASDSADQLLCAICHQPLRDGTAVEALPCAHTMHEYCLNEYAKAQDVERAALRCPVCRLPPAGPTGVLVMNDDIVASQEPPAADAIVDTIQENAAEIAPQEPEAAASSPEPEEADSEPEGGEADSEPEVGKAMGKG